jgi:hypothetical protein
VAIGPETAMNGVEQLQLSDPVLITIELKVDRLWTERELLVQLLGHFSGLLRELPSMLAENDAAAATQRNGDQ